MSGIFDFDLDGQRAQDEQAALNPLDTSKVRDPWDGLSEIGSALGAQSARAGRTIMAVPAGLWNRVRQSDVGKEYDLGFLGGKVRGPTQAQVNAEADAMFGAVDEYGTSAVDFWTPDAAEMGAATRAVATLAEVVGSIPQIVGTPSLFLATSGVDPAMKQVEQGVDADTALAVGGVNLAANAVGMRLPAAFGTKLVTRVATGAAANVAVGVAADAASAGALQAGGYDEQAQGYDVADPYARGLDLLMGAVFGAAARPGVRPADADAVLTARNAQRLASDPAPTVAPDAHPSITAEAIRQVTTGEPVNVATALRPEDFRLPERAAPRTVPVAGGFDAAVERVLRAEGGYVNDPADRGGETNFGISSRANPDIDVRNLTRQGAVRIYRERYWEPIKADTLPAELQQPAFDAAVNQGVGWTRDALKQAGGDLGKFLDLREARYREIVAADPSQKRFFKGWMNRLAEYRKAARTPFADPDSTARAAFTETARRYGIDDDTAVALAPPAPRDGVTGFFEGRIDTAKVALLERAQQHVDATGEPAHWVSADIANLGGLNAHVGNRAEEANVHYRRLAEIVADELRATGAEVVPMRTGGDEFGAMVVNADAAKVDAALAKAEALVLDYTREQGLADIENPKRPGERGVGVHIGRAEVRPGETADTIFNRADDGVNLSKTRGKDVSGGKAGPARATAPEGRPRSAGGGERAAGRGVRPAAGGVEGGARAAADGARGADPAAVALDTPVDAAARLADESPDLMVNLAGEGEEPRYVRMADALDEISAEQADAANDARAFAAAVNCALRRG